jgi:hypothetical protein
MTINFTNLFTQLGHAFKSGNDIDTSAGTTVPASRDAFMNSLAALDATDESDVTSGMNSALSSLQSSAASAINGLVVTPAQTLLKVYVENDHPLLSPTLANNTQELIDQMKAAVESVKANQPSTSTTYGAGGSSGGPEGDNVGDSILVFSTKRGDGLVNEHILPESITAAVTAVATGGAATWSLTGQSSVSETSPLWPGGSGISTSITSVTSASGSLVTTGGFETEDSTATNLPYGWVVAVGVLSTTIKMTAVEGQSVVVNGTPTGGFYTLRYTDASGRVYSTVPITFNAAASTVQSALNSLPGLSSVTVTSTGTSPNYSHTVTMTGVTNPAQLSYVSNLTGGTPTITITTPTPGSANVARGARALEIVGNSSELTTLQVPVSLSATTQYAANLWCLVDVVPAAGVLVMDLVDGVGGTVLTDDQGVANTLSITLSGETTAFAPHPVVFRTPSAMPPTVYLRLRLSTALSTGTSLFIDEVAMVAMTELYTGGLYVAAFSGHDDNEVGDEATVTVTNAMAGLIHTWCNRAWSLRTNRLLLPSLTTGAETQSDALIA